MEERGMTPSEARAFRLHALYEGILSEPGYHIPENFDTRVITGLHNFLLTFKNNYTLDGISEDERKEYDGVLIARYPKYKRSHLDIAIKKCNARINPPSTRRSRNRTVSPSTRRRRGRIPTGSPNRTRRTISQYFNGR